MGGTLQIESTPGEGTSVSFNLPLKSELGEHSFTAPSEGNVLSEISPRSYHDMDVLLVDDHEDNVAVLKLLMEKLGATVSVAHDGQKAVRLALTRHREGNPYDVIFMDLQMPGVDGYSAVSQLREEGYDGWITALTGYDHDDKRERCLSGGFDDYLTKPTTRQHLAGYLKEQRDDKSTQLSSRNPEMDRV